jgi:hypothetical protein
MNRGRVQEERGGKETDGCPLTLTIYVFPFCLLCTTAQPSFHDPL